MKKINIILKYLLVISFKTFSEHEWVINALFFILDMLAGLEINGNPLTNGS